MTQNDSVTDGAPPPDKRVLLERLAAAGQQHVLAFWDELSAQQQHTLAADVAALDLAEINRLFQQQDAGHDWAALAEGAEPPPAFRLSAAEHDTHNDRFSIDEALQRGRAALAAGQIGVVLVAGGQGTRLGFDHPKGMLPIGPVSGASLFQILIEGVVAAALTYGKSIPLYLMTSHATHEATIAYLDEHQRFGLPREDLHVFQQGTMPAVDAEARFAEALAASRRHDAETGGAAVGPHRTNLDVRHRGNGLPAAQRSTGEQKALLIAILLATARLQADERGQAPLLLLDEVAAHLDARHRGALFDALAAIDGQAWMTGTDAAVGSSPAATASLRASHDRIAAIVTSILCGESARSFEIIQIRSPWSSTKFVSCFRALPRCLDITGLSSCGISPAPIELA